MRLLRGSAPNLYEKVHSLSLPESTSYSDSSFVRTENGHFYCTHPEFKKIYEVGISTDGTKLELIKTHRIDEKHKKVTAATVGNIDYLFISAEDNMVRLYRADGNSLKETYKFRCVNPVGLLWLKESSILLVAEVDMTLNSPSVRAFKFNIDMKRIVEEATIMNANEGLCSWICSWIETGANGITLFDWKKKELVELKIT